MLAQVPPADINYGPIIWLIMDWTILCGIIYYIVRVRNKKNESQNHRSILRMSILVLIMWLVPIGVLIIYSDFFIFTSINPIAVLILLQLIIIIIDISRQYQVISKDSIKKLE